LTVLIACHNRKNLTERALQQVLDYGRQYFNFEFVIVDDGSTDGTSDMLEEFQKANCKDYAISIIRGNGDWYWSKSMQIAQLNATQQSCALLWLNDDVDLYEDSFAKLKIYSDTYPNDVLVGQCYDPIRKTASFGGFLNRSTNPLKLIRQTAIESIMPVDTFCGNFVYIPSQVRLLIGTVDGEFEHGHGDLDYGYRVTKAGKKAYCFPGYVGECSKDDEPKLSNRRQAFAYWNSKKKSPMRSQIKFFKRHGGLFWPVWFVTPYLRLLLHGRVKSRLLC